LDIKEQTQLCTTFLQGGKIVAKEVIQAQKNRLYRRLSKQMVVEDGLLPLRSRTLQAMSNQMLRIRVTSCRLLAVVISSAS
jgi:hypothetical protein